MTIETIDLALKLTRTMRSHSRKELCVMLDPTDFNLSDKIPNEIGRMSLKSIAKAMSLINDIRRDLVKKNQVPSYRLVNESLRRLKDIAYTEKIGGTYETFNPTN